ncbi:riboflavin aldehyde-forming enzyme [Lichtheimia corymbifera JMRC:FSU:9682]|uniref:Riboflavin aldehyde-forming enzyme n=1 Tax=Lichtheimia corymbifera JMRC:FSU:9682 TaxID=1263082 RepID=A0A068SF56_9FUNG|nr:riboflavin aldehyde-forming enzyme [Lichtheimia corymbifera JMRC:FSU:9682]
MRYQLCFLVVFLLGALAAPIERRKSSQFSGDLTYYTPGLGSCGETNTAKDLIAALNAPQMANGDNPNKNPNCGKRARVKTKKGSVTVKIVDTCPPCKSGDLDLSPAAFQRLGDFDDGRIEGTWEWV